MNDYANLLRILDAARALHERDDTYPDRCGTCGGPGDRDTWPCPTATALGATGRAEWTNEPAREACDTLPRINPDGWRGHCTKLKGHNSLHADANGETW